MGGKTADRLYVLDCGQGHTEDQSRWTVGVNVGKPIDISVSCYLIHDSQGYLLWDTGISDYVASMPNGWQAEPGLKASTGRDPKPCCPSLPHLMSNRPTYDTSGYHTLILTISEMSSCLLASPFLFRRRSTTIILRPGRNL